MEDVRERENINRLMEQYKTGMFHQVIGHVPFEPMVTVDEPHLRIDAEWLTNKVYDDIKEARVTYKEELSNNIDFRWETRQTSIGIEFISVKGLRIRRMLADRKLTLQDIHFKL